MTCTPPHAVHHRDVTAQGDGPHARRSGPGRLRAFLLAVALVLVPLASAIAAQEAAKPTTTPEPTPQQVQELLTLLDDPVVRNWLARKGAAAPAPAETPAAAEPHGYFAERIAAIRTHLGALAAALPRLPGEFAGAWTKLSLELKSRGLIGAGALIVVFIALGFGVEWLFWRATARMRERVIHAPLETVGERVKVVAMRLAFGTGWVLAFAIGSVGAFLLFDWPPLLRDVVIAYLVAFLALRLALVFGRFLLAPGAERFRILPMSTAAAWYWHRHIAVAVGWFAFGYVTIGLLATLGFDVSAGRLVAYTLGLGLLAIGLHVAWTRPHPAEDTDAPPPAHRHGLRHGSAWLLSAYFVALWLTWVAGAMPLFWFAIVAVGLPVAIRASERAVNHILRPTDLAPGDIGVPSVMNTAIERGMRVVLIIGAALLLAWGWSIDLIGLTGQDTPAKRLIHSVLDAVVIVLLADFAWRVLAAWIDCNLHESSDPGEPDTAEARRRARLRTLLPILRNMLLIVLIAMAGLMALASMGIEIGPLIAGAGVVGVAIGFGAQTLVKDIISGVFFLLDDAFRVGEYIQSGNYKGTVESFSLRSVKLRHHRGPLYTVPFGSLGAVQNMSRDWVIDKMSINVTYDTDLDKVKKIVKDVSKDIMADPELAKGILEPLKSQGVDQMGDFAIQVRMKIMTRPGEQFVVRRQILARIKKAFEENGIKFAFPTVQVAGGEVSAAAAKQALELTKPAAAAE